MVNVINTRAGISPSVNKSLPFSVTTSEVEEYLQKRVDAVVKASNGKVERYEVSVFSTESGTYFIPFVVVLPEKVLIGQSRQKTDMESIIDANNNDDKISIDPAYYKIFSPYRYNDHDEGQFFSDAWRRDNGVNKSTSYMLKRMRTPKIMKSNAMNSNAVVFMIDPVRVFYDMVVSDTDRRNFHIKITGLKRMESGKYRYDFKREIVDSKKNKKYNKTFADELNYRMKGRR